MGGGNTGRSDSKLVGQYRVFVTEALIAGQPVRASTGNTEYLVRVPEHAQTGDTFIFRVTEQDVLMTSRNNMNDTETQHIIETAVLDKKQTWKDKAVELVALFWQEVDAQVLCDRRRIVLLSTVFTLSLCSGFVLGSLFITSDLVCSKCAAAGTTTAPPAN